MGKREEKNDENNFLTFIKNHFININSENIIS